MAKSGLTLDTKGIEDFLERIKKAGGNVDSAAEKALSQINYYRFF